MVEWVKYYDSCIWSSWIQSLPTPFRTARNVPISDHPKLVGDRPKLARKGVSDQLSNQSGTTQITLPVFSTNRSVGWKQWSYLKYAQTFRLRTETIVVFRLTFSVVGNSNQNLAIFWWSKSNKFSTFSITFWWSTIDHFPVVSVKLVAQNCGLLHMHWNAHSKIVVSKFF